MTRLQGWILAIVFIATIAASWTMVTRSKALKNYRYFQAKVVEQQAKNLRSTQKNNRLRRHVTALKYDHRVIEQAARDHLSLTREGEIIVILPR